MDIPEIIVARMCSLIFERSNEEEDNRLSILEVGIAIVKISETGLCAFKKWISLARRPKSPIRKAHPHPTENVTKEKNKKKFTAFKRIEQRKNGLLRLFDIAHTSFSISSLAPPKSIEQ